MEENRYRCVWTNLHKLAGEGLVKGQLMFSYFYYMGLDANAAQGLTKEEKEKLSALYTSDYESHRQRNSKPVPGTYVWFLKNEK